MRWLLLPKIALWLVIIALFALLAPTPAWPRWLAQMVLATGVALGLTSFGVRLWNLRKPPGPPAGRAGWGAGVKRG